MDATINSSQDQMNPNPTQPKATVLMTAYGHQPFLESALASALQQDYPNLEIILIDDGTKPSLEDRVRAVNDNIRYEFMEHKGLPHGWISGMEIATGKYVAILDADDILTTGSISKRVSALESTRKGMCYGKSLMLDDNNKVYAQRPDKACEDFNGLLKNIFLDAWAPFAHSSVMYNRVDALSAGNYCPEFDMAADNEMYLRVAKQFGICHVNDIVVKYRTHKNNFSSLLGRRLMLINERNRMINMHINDPNKRIMYKAINAGWSLAKIAYLMVKSDRTFNAKRSTLKSDNDI